MKDRHILVGVTGGIACYKTCDLVSKLRQRGAKVHVIMTSSAQKFVSPLTFKSLSGNEVHINTFDDNRVIPHIDLANKADALIIAPATANIIAKMAHGIADDILSTIFLACKCPTIIAPAMNVNMYSNPVVQENLKILMRSGVTAVGPESGNLACGTSGMGRMTEPLEIVKCIEKIFTKKQDLKDKKILITAGGTREPIDPVRYIGNRSSGKMGYALASAAHKRGAEVTLISTVSRNVEEGINVIKVETAQEMYQKVMDNSLKMDIIIMAAAVADFKPKNIYNMKIKKHRNDNFLLELEKTPDILKSLGNAKKEGQILIGFAAETENLRENALSKLKDKNIDLIVANDVTQKEAGFESDTNLVTIYSKYANSLELPLASKFEVANRIFDYTLQNM